MLHRFAPASLLLAILLVLTAMVSAAPAAAAPPVAAAPAVADTGRYVVQQPDGSWEPVAEGAAATAARIGRPVEPDRVMHVAGDPYAPLQWSHQTMGIGDTWGHTTGNGAVVAVLDTGVDDDHADLAGQVLAGWDAIEDGPLTAEDANGHGTKVAGMIAAVANNDEGIAGAAPSARILPVRVLGDDGSGWTSDIAEGVDWAVANGADVINLSLGGPSASTPLADAIGRADDAGVLVLAAAGNHYEDGNPRVYPASDAGAWGVAATTSDDDRAYFSQVGDWVDLAAPGQSVVSTSAGGGYAQWSGTSAATPLAAAVAALLLTADDAPSGPDRDDWAAGLLASTAVDLGAAGRDDEFGHGRIDASAAVTAAFGAGPTMSMSAPQDDELVTAPTVTVAGSADGVATVAVSTDPPGPSATATVSGGTFSTNLDLSSLPGGQVTVRVDADGTTRTRTIRYDRSRPTVSVSSPDGDVPAGKVRIAGRTDDDVAVADVVVAVDVPGQAPKDAADDAGRFSATFDLSDQVGRQVTASVTVADVAGRTRTTQRTFDVVSSAGPGTHRRAGTSRYGTSVAVSAAAFPSGADVVYVATGQDFPDALSAVSAAALEDAPLLLTAGTSLPDEVAAELSRLAPRTVKVVGGPQVVSDAVVAQVADHAGADAVVRRAGADRYATAVSVASNPQFDDGRVFLSTGRGYADALSAGAAAAAGRHRLLLTDRDVLPPSTAAMLTLVDPDEVVLVGGGAAIGAPVEGAVRGLLPTADVVRVAGVDRFETATAMSARYFPSATSAWVVTGLGFADALSAGPAAAGEGSPLLLTAPDVLPEPVAAELARLGVVTAFVAGGPSAVSSAVFDRVAGLL